MALNIGKEITALKRMTVPELRRKYAQVFGEDTTSRHKEFLIRRIVWRLQVNQEGGLSERAKRRARDLATGSDVRLTAPRPCPLASGGETSTSPVEFPQDDRLPMPGAIITRRYKRDSVSVLRDNGIVPDLVGGDGIYSSGAFDAYVPVGQYHVSVVARGSFEPSAEKQVSVEVIAARSVFQDGSEDTGDLAQLSGSPYSGIYFDTNIEGALNKVMVVTKDAGDAPEVFRQRSVVDGAPDMGTKNETWFAFGQAPASGSRGTYAADFDNDGFEDFFVCNNGSATRLYRNTSTGFVDETTIWFGANAYLLEGAHVAAWGDYNQDSRLDLFVATSDYTGSIAALTSDPNLANSMGWYLFENRGSSFELTSGTMTYSGGVTLSASWNDVNSDGLLDLVVGEFSSTPGDGPTVLMNQGYKKLSGHFVLSEDPLLSHVPGLNVNSLDWIDYNHDSLPDLVVTEFFPNTGAKILVNTATGFDVAVSLDSGKSWAGAVVSDFDQDGQDDVTLLPADGMPAIFIGDPGDPSSYLELAYPLGLRGGVTSGGIAADFNNDKDMDLYLGRANADPFLYKNKQVNDSEEPLVGQQNWVRFNLLTLGNCNSSLIGTRLTLSDGVMQWHQTVDGGSGRGGQRTNELHFGVGNSSGPFTATVNWGVSSPDVFSGLGVNSVFSLTDLAVPTINGPSLRFSHEPYPGGADWVFTWTTSERGSEELDEVDLDFGSYAPLDYCYRGPDTTLAWGDPNVSISIVPNAGGDWSHTLVWSGQPCLGAQVCNYEFRVRSSVGSQAPQESDWASFGEFDVCITKKNIQQN